MMACLALGRPSVRGVRSAAASLALGLCLYSPLVGAEPGGADTEEVPAPIHVSSESPEYPHVRLTIDPAGGGHTWVLRIQNIDVAPVRLVADARLLSLDVTPPRPSRASPATVHCVLPAEMRPSSDEEHFVVVPPQLSYVEAFDPRLYCFDTRQDASLIPGATVVGRFGFSAQRGKPSPPFELFSADPEVARSPSRQVIGEPFTIPERERATSVSPQAPESSHPDVGAVTSPSVSTPARMDAWSLRDLTLPVTVTNPSARTMRLLLRPETIAIEATGPAGTTRCQWVVAPAPIVELFTTLAPHARATTEVLVSSLCPSTFFDRPGLYWLRAKVDTSLASGEEIGVHSFVGEATAKSATLLRLRTVPRKSGL
jgi:hypothetical protein